MNQDYPGLRDNINVPWQIGDTPGEVKLIIPFLNPLMLGKFVYHCHIVGHEDAGMMQNIEVVRPRRVVAELGTACASSPACPPQWATRAGSSWPLPTRREREGGAAGEGAGSRVRVGRPRRPVMVSSACARWPFDQAEICHAPAPASTSMIAAR